MVSFCLAEVRGARPERHTVTKDRARKQDIRARMAASGEPYSVAARHLVGFGAAGGSMAAMAAKVAACASATLDEPSARMGIRWFIDLPWVEAPETPPEQRRAGAQGLARRLLGALLRTGTHAAGEGFAEPAARRYMIDCGFAGFVCREGAVDQGRHGWRVRPSRPEATQVTATHWLWSLWALTGTATARIVGTEAVRGVACQHLIVEVDLARALEAGGEGWPASFSSGPEVPTTVALAVWIDEQHVRRVSFSNSAHGKVSPEPAERVSADRASTVEVELWDFGTSVAHLDWSRFP
jgi:hypothetical protein